MGDVVPALLLTLFILTVCGIIVIPGRIVERCPRCGYRIRFMPPPYGFNGVWFGWYHNNPECTYILEGVQIA